MDWEALKARDIGAPFIPEVADDLDLRNIDRVFTREKPSETPEDSILLQKRKFD